MFNGEMGTFWRRMVAASNVSVLHSTLLHIDNVKTATFTLRTMSHRRKIQANKKMDQKTALSFSLSD